MRKVHSPFATPFGDAAPPETVMARQASAVSLGLSAILSLCDPGIQSCGVKVIDVVVSFLHRRLLVCMN